MLAKPEVKTEDIPRLSEGDPFRIEKRDGVAIVWFDLPGESVNTLRPGFEKHLDGVLGHLDKSGDIEAVVLASAKSENFVAGADLKALKQIETAGEGTRLSRTAQMGMDWLAEFPLPIVAAIHGSCYGGGLELAMACHARVASHAEVTRFGQLEVQLGLIPGAGGTQRLPRLIGLEDALKLILTGKRIPAERAEALGLVDEIVHPAILIDVALERAHRLASDGRKRRKGLDLKALLLEDNPVGRRVLFGQARERTLARTHGNLPAPLRAIDVIRTGIEEGKQHGLEAEAEAFGELAVSPESGQLRRLFFARQVLKKESGVDDPEVAPRPVRKVAVLGGGLMGAGIAYVTASRADLPVRLKDADPAPLREGLRTIRGLVDHQVEKGRMTRREADQVMAKIRPATEYTGFGRADVVIEAVFEDLDLKRQVLRQAAKHGSPEMIFASNTSSLPIQDIAEASEASERVIGMHYFSPVEKMPLLEVVVTPDTAPWVVATCVDLGKRQDKTVIVVNDGPGLYTTRILGPFLDEAVRVLLDGVPVETVDRALVQFGFPMGPLELLDQVGLDVVAEVSAVLHEAFGARMAPPPGLERLLEADRLGQKAGRGFYRYAGDGPKPDEAVYDILGLEPAPEAEHDLDDIASRCALAMVNEAAHCYGERILRSARDGDVGAVFGLGFPPFLGGPFRYVDAEGADAIVERMAGHRDELGDRFSPAPVLLELAEKGLRFYDEGAPEPGATG